MKYPKIISLVLFLGLLGLGGFGVARILLDKDEVKPTLAAGSFLQLDYIKEDAAITDELARAERQAVLWNARAELVAITMQFDDGLDYDFVKRYAYIFRAPEVASDHIVNNARVAKLTSSTYSPAELFGDLAVSTIDKEYFKINFVQALEIAEQAGGSTFRADHAGSYNVSLLLVKPEGDVLSWVVSYRDRSDQESQIWQVNAATGSVQLQ